MGLDDARCKPYPVALLGEELRDIMARYRRDDCALQASLCELRAELELLKKGSLEGVRRFNKRLRLRVQLAFLKDSVTLSTTTEALEKRASKLHLDARAIDDHRWSELKCLVKTVGMRRCCELFEQYKLAHYDAAEFGALTFRLKRAFVHKLCSALDPFAMHADQYNAAKDSAVCYRSDLVFDYKIRGCREAKLGRLDDAERAFKAGIAKARESRMPWREADTWHAYVEHVLQPRGTRAEHMVELGSCIRQLPFPADTYRRVMPHVDLAEFIA